ncbi:hypothetical protein AGMMS49921_12190 [Endomicrobiia bacterium]|nr:hypothetical protein AGMMS49921_12190 [Endomicrobiia bacterium]
MAINNCNFYTRVLANNETISKRYLIETLKLTAYKNFKKGYFSLKDEFPRILDAICYICTNYATTKYIVDGKIYNAIERQDNDHETHFRSVVRYSSLINYALNGHRKYFKSFKVQLFKLAYAPPPKKIIMLSPYSNILTDIIRVDLISKERLKIENPYELLSAVDTKKKKNLLNLKRKPRSEIALVALEFFKPLFADLLVKNSKGSIGNRYFCTPIAFHTEIQHAIDSLIDGNGYFHGNNINAEKIKVSANDVREIYFFFCLHDNRVGDYISFDFVELASKIYPGFVKLNGNNPNYISEMNAFKIYAKIQKVCVIFQLLHEKGITKGLHFIPIQPVVNKESTPFRIGYSKINIKRL